MDIYKYIIKQDNISKFICNTIRNKIMEGDEINDSVFKDKVIRIIENYISDMKIIDIEGNNSGNSPGLDKEIMAAMDSIEF